MTILEETEQAAEYLRANCHPECARKMQAAADEIRRLQHLLDNTRVRGTSGDLPSERAYLQEYRHVAAGYRFVKTDDGTLRGDFFTEDCGVEAQPGSTKSRL